MTPRTLAALALLAVLGGSTAAFADAPRAVGLEYIVDRGAPRCPAEQVFRDTVTGRMRFDPFVDDAAARIVVTIRHEAGLYHGRAELRGGSEPWSQDVTPALRDCRTLVHALGIHVAYKLDPAGALPPNAEPQPPAAGPAPKPPARVRTPPKAIPAARPFQVRVGLNANLAVWIAPSDVAFEGAADIGLRWTRFSLSAEFRGSPPAGAEFPLAAPIAGTYQSKPTDAAEVSTARLAGAIVPCMLWPFSRVRLKPTPFACGVVQGGGVFGSASGLEGAPTLPYAAGGVRLGLEVEVIKRLTARLGSDFLGVLNRSVLRVQGQTVWEGRPFTMAFGGGMVASF